MVATVLFTPIIATLNTIRRLALKQQQWKYKDQCDTKKMCPTMKWWEKVLRAFEFDSPVWFIGNVKNWSIFYLPWNDKPPPIIMTKEDNKFAKKIWKEIINPGPVMIVLIRIMWICSNARTIDDNERSSYIFEVFNKSEFVFWMYCWYFFCFLFFYHF